ncbi:hypothetical protein CSOJ01_13820 [Colletotrichum sojae]|uniref:Nucleic-acid-binding protein from transposon X-element n=1 Tax=Colletotrichum sojae TaxID=2175907 RepID=A0A8H6MKV6_9PEZI|nr:hypothetical protein CSOJ01_13820 [Colletotrichum sojae]
MALQPPGGSGLQPAPPAGPDRGSGMPPEPTPTPRAKRRRDTEAQPLRPSLAGSQPDTLDTAPLTAKGPPNASGAATGSILAALDEQTRVFEARKDVFLTITQSVDNVVSSFEGPKKQIAKEATACVIQALKRLMSNETAPTSRPNWATVAASAPAATPVNTRTPTRSQALTQAQAKPPPKEDLRVFARIPEEGLMETRKHAPFALRQTICQTLGLQLSDIPTIYHMTTGLSLRPLNKQVQQGLLANKQKLADCLGAVKVETPARWFTYAVPCCPYRLQSLDGKDIDVVTLIEDEVMAQTGKKPILARQSRLGPNVARNEVTWVISFTVEVPPFQLFNQSNKAQLIHKKRTLIRHDPGCQGYHTNRYCNRPALCYNCSKPLSAHEPGPCTARPKCANCLGPSPAGHADCPVRPIVVNGHHTLPGQKERTRIRRAGQKATEALYSGTQTSPSNTQQTTIPTTPIQDQQPSPKRPRTRAPLQSSIVCLGDGDTASSMDEDEAEDEAEDGPEDTEALPLLNRPAQPLSERRQRVTQKPDYNVANAYTQLDLDSEA